LRALEDLVRMVFQEHLVRLERLAQLLVLVQHLLLASRLVDVYRHINDPIVTDYLLNYDLLNCYFLY
jgi:hypothetical protein